MMELLDLVIHLEDMRVLDQANNPKKKIFQKIFEDSRQKHKFNIQEEEGEMSQGLKLAALRMNKPKNVDVKDANKQDFYFECCKNNLKSPQQD